MPGLRYRNPAICDHLASQYVTGFMTPRLRRRMEALLETTPELQRAVAFWADSVAPLQLELPEETPDDKVWDQIAKSTNKDTRHKHKTSNNNWWNTLFFWKSVSFGSLAASLVLGSLLLFSGTPQVSIKPSYMAAMALHNAPDSDIQFIVTAYKKSTDKSSWLKLQWSARHKRSIEQAMHLWAEDKDSGELTYIGPEPADKKAWRLETTNWRAIANSSRLLMTSNALQPNQNNLLFSGQCVQLQSWKTET
ncbi:MAG: hypothetical protein ACRBHB_11585 [Arenicella sp.]